MHWVLLLGLMALLGSCSASSIYEPVSYKELYGRKALFLEPTYLQPLERELHREIVNRMEKGLADSPMLGGMVARERFREAARGNPALMRNYGLVSDTLSVVGMAERETTARLGKVNQAELLIVTQPLYIPCPECEESSLLVLTGVVVEVATAKILWRIQLIEEVSEEPESFPDIAEQMVADFFDSFTDSLRPKWHRLRFDNLKKNSSS